MFMDHLGSAVKVSVSTGIPLARCDVMFRNLQPAGCCSQASSLFSCGHMLMFTAV